ncbi:class I adenylate-forming enzyme family protein [Actinoplanes italicus]|uniref:Acyl-CoA synthetase (AMP-forming)/AMP-acid ligase II n=1 Tax=Actinoplanes italicus TaxID=113567 RepID=A0A2T0K7U2_9ACTN|nr:fatty acid--CoA ligase family protein [Actinoplanes italicus]PRX19082.1 acyl-CoA synthetase (AMP-forming)/AMP-acid ligase II [Actinoplanes italicus]
MLEVAALLGWENARAAERPVLGELTTEGTATMSGAELRTDVIRVARHAERLRPTVIAVLDGSRSSIAVLLGLLAAAVDVVVVEAGNSHLRDERSVIWSTGARTLIKPESSAVPAPTGPTELTYDDLLAPDPGRAWTPPSGSGSASPDLLLLTSGSTSEPRLARQPMRAAIRGGELYRSIHGYGPADRILLPVPVAHSFGLVGGLFAGLSAGAQVLTMPKFSVGRLVGALADGVSAVLGTPLLYSMLVRAWGTEAHTPGLRLLLSSGGPLPQETADGVRRLCGVPVYQVYGSTETGLVACQDSSREAWHPGSVGAFAPDVQWELLPDMPGEDSVGSGRRLAVRTSTMFTGYSDGGPGPGPGLYETGDLVRISDTSELFLLGRKQTFINVGGKKVNPQRVARVVGYHPDVAEVHVFGVEKHGEQTVHAAVVAGPRGGAGLPAGVTALCRERLAAHEVPHHVHLLRTLPRSALGKVDISALLAAVGVEEDEA